MKNHIRKKLTVLLLALAMCLCLAACGNSSGTKANTASVQSVSMLVGLDMSGSNRYSGVTQAKSTQKIEKDANKTVEECCVEVGQEVHKGDVLFRYDTEALKLSVESAELEVEQLQNSISSYDTQISELQKEKKSAGKSEQLSYTLQIQETQLSQAEAQYNLKQKQAELEKLKKSAEETEVTASVDGVVQSINSDDSLSSDYSGDSSGAYITIMETGTYLIKGTASENNIYSLYEEMPVTILSRTDSSQIWNGTISEIDTGSTEDNASENTYYDDSGSGESASKYSFYVTLDSSEGLMMGQHVYILPGALEEGTGISLPAEFLILEDDSAYVWAASSRDTLEKRAVTLGDYNDATDSYEIVDGLTLDDYIASPDDSLAEGMIVVKYDADSYGFSDGEEMLDGDTSWSEEAFGDMSAGYEDWSYEDFGDMSAGYEEMYEGDVSLMEG